MRLPAPGGDDVADDSRSEDASGPVESGDSGPLEERTQPISTPDDDADLRNASTTTVPVRHAPPRIVDEPPEPEPAAEPPGEPRSPLETGTIPLELEAPGVAAPVSTETASPDTTGSAADAATEVAPLEDASTRGSIPPSSSLHPILLERVEPSLGRGERLRLDAAHWRVRLGRAEHNEIRLYTASASREHAEIAGSPSGEWILTPAPGKSVLVDGSETHVAVPLEVGMNLVLGGDHLRCVTESLSRPDATAQTAAEGLGESRRGGLDRSWLLILGVGVLGLVLLAVAWFVG